MEVSPEASWAEMDVPDIATMAPASGRVGAPDSGTYGEKAQAAQLEADLPSSSPSPGPSPQALPPMGGGMPTPPPPSGAGGLPAGIIAPTRRPGEAVSTPLSMPAPVAATSSEQQIQTLQMWANDPQRSQIFREWAQIALEKLGAA
jgi:hypothetical protein